ncbi:MAG: hypothetical protein M3081_22015 [Gemmatimonadota bacterium]|nr:hypothetical protein [Gemmatimonadota bacterium]
MKARIFALAMMCMVFSGGLQAQAERTPISISVSGGPTTGSFSNEFPRTRGGHAEIALSFAPSAWPILLRGEFGVQRFSVIDNRPGCPGPADGAFPSGSIGPGCGQYAINDDGLSGTLSIVLPRNVGPVSTYLIGGIGTYSLAEVARWTRVGGAQCPLCDTGTLQFDRSWTRLGYNAGGGLAIPLGQLSLFGEVRYHYLPGDIRAYMVPITIGLRR